MNASKSPASPPLPTPKALVHKKGPGKHKDTKETSSMKEKGEDSDSKPPIVDTPESPSEHSKDPPNHSPSVVNNSVTSWTSHCLPAKPIVLSASPMKTNSSVMIQKNVDDGRCYSPLYSCFSLVDSKNNGEVELKTEDRKQEDEDNKISHTISEQGKCFLPRIVQELDNFRIVQIHRRQEKRKESVLFVGNIYDLFNGVKTSEYVPRNWFLSRLFGFDLFCVIPRELEEILLLTAGLSAGLAVVNMLPIYGLDGYHVVDALVRSTIGQSWDARRISRVVKTVSCSALVVALLTIFCSVVQHI